MCVCVYVYMPILRCQDVQKRWVSNIPKVNTLTENAVVKKIGRYFLRYAKPEKCRKIVDRKLESENRKREK